MEWEKKLKYALRRHLWWIKALKEEQERRKYLAEFNEARNRVPANHSRNVILLSVDSLGSKHLGCYGYPRPVSANLDRLAKNGVLFERVITQANWTKPALASVHTSLFPSVHRADSAGEAGDRVGVQSANILSDRFRTMAQSFLEGGFATAGFTNGGYAHSFFGFGRGFAHYDNYAGGIKSCLSRLLLWILQNVDRPFFAYIHCWDAHFPYTDRPPYNKRFIKRRASIALDARTRSEINRGQRSLSPREVEFLKGLYDGCINLVDDQIPFLLTELERLGLAGNTFLAVTGDHGEAFCEHGTMEHTECIYNEVLQVPLIITGPGLPVGRRIPSQVRSLDIMPTLLDLCGLVPPQNIQGVSLNPWILGRRHDHLLAVTETERRGGQKAIQDGRQKLIQMAGGGRTELYDLTTDPGEKTDLSASSKELRVRMEEALASWEYQVERLRLHYWSERAAAESQEISAEVVKRLQDLGYLE